jgi:diacylglycerol kinase (ATP)
MAVVDPQVDRGDRHDDPARPEAGSADVLSAARAATPAGNARAPLVLLNPQAAGGRAAALAPRLGAWLAAHAPDARLVLPAGIGEGLAALHALPANGRAVLVGGDGTVHRMLPPFVENGLTMGLVPFGSGNDFARALGLHGWGWERALRHALTAPARAIDLGEATIDGARRVPFVSSLTAGFDSSVGQRAIDGPTWLRGLPRYLLATLRELANLRHWPIDATIDGAPLHAGAALFVSVLNTRSFGSGMPAVPHARIDDGRLDVLAAGPVGLGGVALLLPRLLVGRHLGHPLLRTAAFERLEAHSPVDVQLAAEGEPLGPARRWSVVVRPAGLRVVAAQA